MRDFFYRPEKGYVGDVIPYYEDGIYYLYFLYASRKKYEEGTSWYLVTTRDFIHYKEYGEVLAHGTEEDQDLNAYTGSIYKNDGVYYLYYTGYNAHSEFRVQGEPLQAVMMAKSNNLFTWEKLPEKTFYASEDYYEFSDWRDPFVFWNEERKEYEMLLAARQRKGSGRKRGCVGLCRSDNLLDWKASEAYYAPGLYMTHECPEAFRMGRWKYLLFSTFSERFATHYRIVGAAEGDFVSPREDTFDGRGFYAGKTASDGEKRFIFGWVPTKKEENDYGDYEWAGNLVVHELMQRKNGILYAGMPSVIKRYFQQEVPFLLNKICGNLSKEKNGRFRMNGRNLFSAAVTEEELPGRCLITAKMCFEEGTRALGILLRSDGEAEQSYYIRLEPYRNRMVFDMWPRKIKGENEDTWEINGDKPFFPELERDCPLKPGEEYVVSVLVDDTVCVVYVEGMTAMTSRIYNIKRGRLGVFVSEGCGEFYDLSIKRNSKDNRERQGRNEGS